MASARSMVSEMWRGQVDFRELPAAVPFLSAALVAWITLAVGWYVFHRAEHRFAEEI